MAAPRYHLRLARSEADRAAALALRTRLFRGRTGDAGGATDGDKHDDACEHVLMESGGTGGDLVGCFRLRLLQPFEVSNCYSAEFYDLAMLASRPGPLLELGRFCLAPGRLDADVLRLAWGALTRRVEASGAAMIFGCTSFAGADPAAHAAALRWLGAHHRAPADTPCIRARADVTSVPLSRGEEAAATPAPRGLPALLRSYLGLGGHVSDDAVLDPVLDTLHVLTILPIAAIPAARRDSLRRAAAQEAAFGAGL